MVRPVSLWMCRRLQLGRERRSDGRTYYRCRYPKEYALANELEHQPRVVYVREDEVMPALDGWLASLFDPENIDETCRTLAAASGPSDADEAALNAARRKLADCDGRLAKYRAALDNGADPTVVAAWIAEVQGERLAAERTLATARASVLTAEDVRKVIEGLGDLVSVLAKAKPATKAKVYADLGIRLVYRPHDRMLAVEAAPRVPQRVSEDRWCPYVHRTGSRRRWCCASGHGAEGLRRYVRDRRRHHERARRPAAHPMVTALASRNASRPRSPRAAPRREDHCPAHQGANRWDCSNDVSRRRRRLRRRAVKPLGSASSPHREAGSPSKATRSTVG
jgi:hypothetical protein